MSDREAEDRILNNYLDQNETWTSVASKKNFWILPME